MSCFNGSRIISIEFKAQYFDLLEEAVRSLKYTVLRGPDYVSFYANHGRITIREGSIDVEDERDRHIINKLKQQYARLAVKKAVLRCGLVIKPTSNKDRVRIIKR